MIYKRTIYHDKWCRLFALKCYTCYYHETKRPWLKFTLQYCIFEMNMKKMKKKKNNNVKNEDDLGTTAEGRHSNITVSILDIRSSFHSAHTHTHVRHSNMYVITLLISTEQLSSFVNNVPLLREPTGPVVRRHHPPIPDRGKNIELEKNKKKNK